jgi:MraZ protein
MRFFSSTSTHKIDAKGRVSIPASFRKVLDLEPQPGVMLIPQMRGEQAIEGLGLGRFEQLVEAIDAMNPLEEETMALSYAVMGMAHHGQLDENGRIVLGADLREAAGLTDQALFVGLGRSFQIWNPDTYAMREEEMREKARASFHRLPWGGKPAPEAR